MLSSNRGTFQAPLNQIKLKFIKIVYLDYSRVVQTTSNIDNNVLLITCIYIIGHYNASVRVIDLVSHTTYDVCVNFIHKCTT